MTLFVVGTGPGDPELLTLKAARIIAAVPVVAYFAKRGRPGHARSTAASHVAPGATLLRFEYPYTTEIPLEDPRYAPALSAFYAECAAAVGARLEAGQDVALLCEGDPFFYGSAMYVFDVLSPHVPTEVVPGVTAMGGCWAEARLPMTHGDDVLSVLPGTLPTPELTRRLTEADAAVVMKVGSNLPRIRDALDASGRLDRALLVERGTMDGSRITPMAQAGAVAPYFSLVLVPGRRGPR